jgi:hypothetical protein
MERQLFVVTLEVPSVVSHSFPRVEDERMADIIRDAVQAKSCSFMSLVPFKITVERMDEATSVSGEMREYRAEEFPEIGEAVRE